MFNMVQEKKIKDRLPKNWCTLLSLKTKTSRGLVHKVVTEELEEHEIWPAIIDLIKEEKERIRKNQELTKEVMSDEEATTTQVSKTSTLASA